MRTTTRTHGAGLTATEFRALLESAGLTIRAAAALLDVGNATISRWQTGKSPISRHSAKLISLVIVPKRA